MHDKFEYSINWSWLQLVYILCSQVYYKVYSSIHNPLVIEMQCEDWVQLTPIASLKSAGFYYYRSSNKIFNMINHLAFPKWLVVKEFSVLYQSFEHNYTETMDWLLQLGYCVYRVGLTVDN